MGFADSAALCFNVHVISLYGISTSLTGGRPIFQDGAGSSGNWKAASTRSMLACERMTSFGVLRGFHPPCSVAERPGRSPARDSDSMLAKLATEPQLILKYRFELFRSELIGAEAAASTHPAASP